MRVVRFLLTVIAFALLASCAVQGGGPGPGTGGVSFSRVLALGFGSSGSLEVDAQGVLNVAYIDPVIGQLQFARCASGCDQTANWKLVKLSNGVIGGSPVLQLDPSGHPRIAWAVFGGVNPEGDVLYLECNANCVDNSANWQFVRVSTMDTKSYQYVAANNPTFFALDRQGRPRIAFHSGGSLRLANCPAQCLQATN